MNTNKKRNSEIIVIWDEEEKKFKTVEELERFIDEKFFDFTENKKILIFYKEYKIEYDFGSQKYSCEDLGIFEINDLYEITDEIDKIEKNKSKIMQSMDREI